MTKLGTLALALAMTSPVFAHGLSEHGARDVRHAQETLDELGYPVGGVDGELGPRTRTALRNFQRDKGLNATGQLDEETAVALDRAAKHEDAHTDDPGAKPQARGAGDVGPATVRRAQSTLDRLGYPIAHIDGQMGEETRTAIRNFQRDRGLNATGELDADTRAKLDADSGATSGTGGAR
jgi:peptidoglycan hydrolase-like protein with peptidoglycan-binding domain